MGIRITPRHNENVQTAMRRLRKLCEREGIQKELRKHEFYEKPSEKRRREKRNALRKARQEEQERSEGRATT